MEECNRVKKAAKRVLVDQNNNNNNIKVTINMETNTKTLKFFDHGYSNTSSVSGSENRGRLFKIYSLNVG